MIRTIGLRRFRGFSKVDLPLNRLTVLLGPNSSGKSTFGAALVALREIQESKTGEPALAPEGGRKWPVELGRYEDLFHDKADPVEGQDDVEVAVELKSGTVKMGFGGRQLYRGGSATQDLLLTRLVLPGEQVAQMTAPPMGVDRDAIKVVQTAGGPTGVVNPFHRASEFVRQNAEVWRTWVTGANGARLESEVHLFFRGLVTMGARLAGSRSDVAVETQAQLDLANILTKLRYLGANRLTPARKWADADASDVGPGGEWTPQFLFHHRARDVGSGIVTPPPSSIGDAERNTRSGAPWFREQQVALLDGVNYWMNYVQLAETITSASEGGAIVLRARLPLQVRARDLTDVGFGLSQVLPVIVAGLVAPVDGLLVLDQPESQLHPRSQAGVADFLCMLVKTGRFILVETHSEALFHRLRLRAAMDEELARAMSVYFLDAARDVCAEPRPVSLAPDGALEWPEGFLAEGMQEELSIRAVVAAHGESTR